jgi:hypothetical protein
VQQCKQLFLVDLRNKDDSLTALPAQVLSLLKDHLGNLALLETGYVFKTKGNQLQERNTLVRQITQVEQNNVLGHFCCMFHGRRSRLLLFSLRFLLISCIAAAETCALADWHWTYFHLPV